MGIRINFPSGYSIKDTSNDNVDINILFDNGDVYFSTLFTLSNIDALMTKESSSYFWATDMIVVKDLRVESIKKVVLEIVEHGLLEDHFSKIGNEESVFGMPPRYGELITIEG